MKSQKSSDPARFLECEIAEADLEPDEGMEVFADKASDGEPPVTRQGYDVLKEVISEEGTGQFAPLSESRLRSALIRWCQCEPKEFVAVISVLRDGRRSLGSDPMWDRLLELACEYLPLAKLAGRTRGHSG